MMCNIFNLEYSFKYKIAYLIYICNILHLNIFMNNLTNQYFTYRMLKEIINVWGNEWMN